MIIAQSGVIHKIYKHPTDLWCVEIKRTDTRSKGTTTYIGIKAKPKLKVGQRVSAGDEI